MENKHTQQVDFSNPNADKITSNTTSTKLSFKAKAQEEAAKEFVLSHDFSRLTNPNHLANRCFQYGAEWNQEQILQFLYSEITERRPYSSSKMCEKVIEFIEQLNTKK